MVPPLVELALAFYRKPLEYMHLSDLSQPLPEGFGQMLGDLGSALSAAQLDETARQLGVESDELYEAGRFFLRQALLSPAANHYRSLGLNRNCSQEEIKANYQVMIRMFHPDRITDPDDVDLAYSARINNAYRCLRDPEAPARSDRHPPHQSPCPVSTDAAHYFEPSNPSSVARATARPARLRSGLGRRGMAGVLVTVLVIAGIYLVSRPDPAPMLRLTQPAEDLARKPSRPAYLHGPTSEAGLVAPDLARAAVDAAKTSRQVTNAPLTPPKEPRPSELGPSNAAQALGGDSTQGIESMTQAPAQRLGSSASPKPVDRDPLPGIEERLSHSLDRAIPVAETRESTKVARQDTGTGVGIGADTGEAGSSHARPIESRSAKPSTSSDAEVRTAAPAKHKDRPRAAGVATVEPPGRVGARIIGAYERAYRAGDTEAIVALFTSNGRTPEGGGRAFLRKDFRKLFNKTSERSLEVSQMRWTRLTDGRIRGSGRVSVSVKFHRSGWRRLKGPMILDLVEVGGRFRIARVHYDLG